jgi:hypothetical protein
MVFKIIFALNTSLNFVSNFSLATHKLTVVFYSEPKLKNSVIFFKLGEIGTVHTMFRSPGSASSRRIDVLLIFKSFAIFDLLNPFLNNDFTSAVLLATVISRPWALPSFLVWAIPAFTRSRNKLR